MLGPRLWPVSGQELTRRKQRKSSSGSPLRPSTGVPIWGIRVPVWGTPLCAPLPTHTLPFPDPPTPNPNSHYISHEHKAQQAVFRGSSRARDPKHRARAAGAGATGSLRASGRRDWIPAHLAGATGSLRTLPAPLGPCASGRRPRLRELSVLFRACDMKPQLRSGTPFGKKSSVSMPPGFRGKLLSRPDPLPIGAGVAGERRTPQRGLLGDRNERRVVRPGWGERPAPRCSFHFLREPQDCEDGISAPP